MASEVNRGGVVDGLSYLVFGNGHSETTDPFCEATLISPYPYTSLAATRTRIASEGRIVQVAAKLDNVRHALWHIDGVVSVKGLNEETVNANRSIWSTRRTVALTAYWTSVLSTLSSAAYGLFMSEAGLSVANGLFSGDAVAARILPTALSTAWAGFGTPIGMIGLTAFIGGAIVWYIASKRWNEANRHVGLHQKAMCHTIAEKRASIVQGDLYKGVNHRGAWGSTSQNGIIAPQETEWLWMEAVKQERTAFENPLMRTGGELVLNFALLNPLDVMDRALLRADETNHALLAYVEGAKETYAPLIAEVRSVKQTYDVREKNIKRQAEHNRRLIQDRKQAALNVVDSVYWTQVDEARRERDRRLSPFMPHVTGLSLADAKAKQRTYESNPAVMHIKNSYQSRVASYNSYRALAHAGIKGWFDPQLRREREKEKADLKINHRAELSHLSLFYPAVRALYRWVSEAVETFERVQKSRQGAPPSYAEAMAGRERPPRYVAVTPPMMPQMLTEVAPEAPDADTMRSWADAGSGLGLGLFLTCAKLGTDFYAAYQRDRGRYERIIEEHAPAAPAPVEDAPPSYEEAAYYDLPPAYAPPVVPSAPMEELPPPYTPPIPSAPPENFAKQ